jgi:hypothetical protein
VNAQKEGSEDGESQTTKSIFQLESENKAMLENKLEGIRKKMKREKRNASQDRVYGLATDNTQTPNMTKLMQQDFLRTHLDQKYEHLKLQDELSKTMTHDRQQRSY